MLCRCTGRAFELVKADTVVSSKARWIFASNGFLLLMTLRCANDYPIAPTFCDDFCRATLRSGCDREPENCVRECELGFRRDACNRQRQVLLECYRRAPDNAFACNERGTSVRIRDDFCRHERDDALTCELPGMRECLSLCRPLQQALDEDASSESTSGGADMAANHSSCPLLRESCETLCWNILSFGVIESEQAVSMVPTNNGADAGLNAENMELLNAVSKQCGVSIRSF